MLKQTLSYLFCCGPRTDINELDEIDLRNNPTIKQFEPFEVIEFNESPKLMISSKKMKLSNSDSEEELHEKLMDQPKILKQLLPVTKDRLHIRRKNQRLQLKPVKPACKPIKPEIKKFGSEPCLWLRSSPPRSRKKSKSHENFNDVDKFPVIDKKITGSLTYPISDQVSKSSSNNEIFLTPPSGRKTFDKRDKLSLPPKSLSQDAISKQNSDEFRSRISSDPGVSLSICNEPSNPNTSEDKNSNVQLHVKLAEVESQRVDLKICGLKNLGNTSRSSSNNEIFVTPPSGRQALCKKDKLSLPPISLSQDAISKQISDESRSRISSDPALSLSICNKPSNPNTAEDKNSNIQLHVKLVEVESQRVHLKVCGLKNLGNTCYMNSALQCLVHTEPLRELIEPTCKNDSRTLQASQPSDRNLASSFSLLIKDMLMAPGLGYCNPCDLKKAIESHAPIFKGNAQQDAQELITLFIGGLHEEFNEITGKKTYVTMEVDESQFESEEEIADEWRKLSEKRDKSEIIEIFYGQIKCTMKCQNSSCGYKQKVFEPVFPLTLPIPKKPKVSLDDCLKLYTKEKLSSDPWYCEECNEVVTLSRKVEMWNMPQILMVYLKRFCLKRGIHTKINDHVKFDFMFPLEDFCPREKENYQLYAVINHNGSLQYGHYYAFVKCQDKWYECNDSICNEISVDDVITSSAYVLFYERVKVNGNEAYVV